jgi:hypothetical protein
MSKLLKTTVAVLAAVPVLAFSLASASADSPGQLEGGSGVYVVKNVTKSGSYGTTASAACNEEVRYSIRLHNTAFSGLSNIQVKTNLSDGSMSAVPAEGTTYGTNGKVNISVANGGNLVYENGTAKLYNASGSVIKTLPDTITSSGVNVGGLNGSTTEFVNFNAKVNCPTPPTTPTPTPKPTPTPQPTPAPEVKAPEALPNTGAGDVLGLFTGASAAGAAVHTVARRFRK